MVMIRQVELNEAWLASAQAQVFLPDLWSTILACTYSYSVYGDGGHQPTRCGAGYHIGGSGDGGVSSVLLVHSQDPMQRIQVNV